MQRIKDDERRFLSVARPGEPADVQHIASEQRIRPARAEYLARKYGVRNVPQRRPAKPVTAKSETVKTKHEDEDGKLQGPERPNVVDQSRCAEDSGSA